MLSPCFLLSPSGEPVEMNGMFFLFKSPKSGMKERIYLEENSEKNEVIQDTVSMKPLKR